MTDKTTRKRLPSKALMQNAFEAAKAAGFDNARLEVLPQGGIAVTAYNGDISEHGGSRRTHPI